MYSLYSYGQMLAEGPRMTAYTAALERAVKPGSVVLDLGCGPGVFALMACRLGARRVYAVEPDNVIEIAREVVKANGFSDRVEFFQNLSTEITLAEPADVIVSDLRGVLPLYGRHIPSIIDARKRLLAPHGTLIPRRDMLWAAVVETADRYEEIVGPWEAHGFDLSAATRVVTNTWRKTRIEARDLLTEPARWETLDYDEIESADVRADVAWTIARPGKAHGIAVWFDSELIEDIGFSNAPGGPELIYGNALLPFSHPVSVAEGDGINVTLSADFVGDDYVWRWETEFTGETAVSFKQSTFFGAPLSPSQLRKRTATYKPSLNAQGEARSFILKLMNGENSLSEIATRVVERFPERYADWNEAFSEVANVSQDFSG